MQPPSLMGMRGRGAVQAPWDVLRWVVAVPTSEEADWHRTFLCPSVLVRHLMMRLPWVSVPDEVQKGMDQLKITNADDAAPSPGPATISTPAGSGICDLELIHPLLHLVWDGHLRGC
jgi:hypothetical protein